MCSFAIFFFWSTPFIPHESPTSNVNTPHQQERCLFASHCFNGYIGFRETASGPHETELGPEGNFFPGFLKAKKKTSTHFHRNCPGVKKKQKNKKPKPFLKQFPVRKQEDTRSEQTTWSRLLWAYLQGRNFTGTSCQWFETTECVHE